jgi:hypothetical protein
VRTSFQTVYWNSDLSVGWHGPWIEFRDQKHTVYGTSQPIT